MKTNSMTFATLLAFSLIGSISALADTFAPVEIEIHTKTAHLDQERRSSKLDNIREITLARAIWRDDAADTKLLAVKGVSDTYATKLKIEPRFAEMNALTSLLSSGEIASIVATRDCLNCDIKIVSIRNREGKECKINEERPGLFECALQKLFTAEINRSPTLKHTINAFRRPTVSSTDDFQQVLSMQKNFYAEMALAKRTKAPNGPDAILVDSLHSPMR